MYCFTLLILFLILSFYCFILLIPQLSFTKLKVVWHKTRNMKRLLRITLTNNSLLGDLYITQGVLCIVIIIENGLLTNVQIQDKAVCILLHANALGKGMN